MTNKKVIHVCDKNYQYVDNIIYAYSIPFFTEEELEDVIIEHFPQLKGERWHVSFS